MKITPLKRILLVGNSDRIEQSLKDDLESEGILLSSVNTFAEARSYLIKQGIPDGMIISLQELEDEGLDFCNEMTRYAGLPVIVLGSDNSTSALALETLDCADTYLRPEEADSAEIAARLTRLFGRIKSIAAGVGRTIHLSKDMVLDLINGLVTIRGQDTVLTPTEVALLHVLLTHDHEMVDSTTLIDRVWRGASEGNANSLRVHMHRLRKKLQWKKRDETSLIKTVRGIGYMLDTRP
jgi:two-component system, OmpR family, response regulator protein BraR/BceR